MPLKGLIQSQLNLAHIGKINKAIEDIQAAVTGKIVDLTPEERQKYGSINEQNELMATTI